MVSVRRGASCNRSLVVGSGELVDSGRSGHSGLRGRSGHKSETWAATGRNH
ncbi:MAG: hypothetical protein K9M99_06620 [Candidatus Cloacimonetes bacterium]|nr:hypothetical protein [Candidatus Cloacimonadota bacterium]